MDPLLLTSKPKRLAGGFFDLGSSDEFLEAVGMGGSKKAEKFPFENPTHLKSVGSCHFWTWRQSMCFGAWPVEKKDSGPRAPTS